MAEAGFGSSQGERRLQTGKRYGGLEWGEERRVAHKGLFWRNEGWLQPVIVRSPKGSLRIGAALALEAPAGGCLWLCGS